MRLPLSTLALTFSSSFLIACTHAVATTGSSTPTPATACFPLDALAADDRRVAEQVLLEFSDREGLYTLAGGLKPVSSDVRDLSFRVAPSVDSVALGRVEQLRRVTAALSCGEITTFVQIFTATSPGRAQDVMRNATLVIAHRASLRALIVRQRSYFAALGITPSADPRDVVSAVENASRAERWRGYGLLFGYPDEAVEFFVNAGVEGDSTKRLVPRDFRRIETFFKFPESRGATPTMSSFVYAVPKGAPDSDGDRRLRAQAAPIYAKYVTARAAHIRADSTGAAALWREWKASAQR
ncbi:MAG: hypothetical protein IT353_19550 [Gemmatimonadaceae bacterium]|nr:hypothetical protein [Gemmatimonadaceae bacterium]